MQSIRKSEVPLYLQSTSFYRALEEGGGDELDIPINCLKTDTTLKTELDVIQLIATIRFWGVEGVPLELIEYAFLNTYDNCRDLFDEAINDLPYLNVLSKLQASLGVWQIDKAMRCGEVAIVQYLHENGQSMEYAAANGHLECMRYAHEHGCAWTEGTFIYAAGKGHLECLIYAVDNGCPADLSVYHRYFTSEDLQNIGSVKRYWEIKDLGACAFAAHNGHVHILAYLRASNLCYWNAATCAVSAGNGQLACLKFAHENRCSWNGWTTALAAEYGHWECLDYAFEQGCGICPQTLLWMHFADHPVTGNIFRQLCAAHSVWEISFVLFIFVEGMVLTCIFRSVLLIVALCGGAWLYL